MALFNESLEGRFNALITRMHGMKGGTPAPQITPEITHVIVIENDRPEQLYHAQTHLWGVQVSAAANATHISVVGIQNAIASGTLVTVTHVEVLNENAAVFDPLMFLRAGIGSYASLAPSGVWRDTREFRVGTNATVGVLSDSTGFANSNALVGELVSGARVPLGDMRRITAGLPAILHPRSELLVCGGVNQAITVNFAGYMRAASAEDLALQL